MNMIEAAEFHTVVTLYAGGPGSGRHKEILEQHGFQEGRASKVGLGGTKGSYTTYNGSGKFKGHEISVGTSGESKDKWQHRSGENGTLHELGNNASDLAKHLKNTNVSSLNKEARKDNGNDNIRRPKRSYDIGEHGKF